MSLSARRAWIEMCYVRGVSFGQNVALRKESVDRNSIVPASMRVSIVALRKESVDRNNVLQCNTVIDGQCRSPQGERG